MEDCILAGRSKGRGYCIFGVENRILISGLPFVNLTDEADYD